MLADVAQRRSAEQCIAQCVQCHVSIGMSCQAFFVGNAHATEHHVVALGKGMHIESLAYPDRHAFTPVPTAAAE